MDKKRCENCKFWSYSLTISDNVSDCGMVGKENFYIDVDVNDSSGLDYNLMTHKDFCCSEWTEKKDEYEDDY